MAANSTLPLLSLLLLLLPLSLLLFLYLIVRPRPVKVPINNRHVFITGASSGIGLALAQQAAAEGAKVSILARNARRLEDAKHAIRRATGRDVAAFSADVRDYDAVKMAVEAAGPVDVLVCNHGVYASKEMENQELEEVKLMIDVNLTGSFHLIKAALPGMIGRPANSGPGSIAIMSSQANKKKLKRRPKISSKIAASSGALIKAEEVAKKALNGIKCGSFSVACNLEGFFLSIATAALSPQPSFLMAFVETCLVAIVRIAALCFLWNWYRIIQKWHPATK